MTGSRQLIMGVTVASGATADGLETMLHRLGKGDWDVERVHDPAGDEPDFYVGRPREDDDEEVSGE